MTGSAKLRIDDKKTVSQSSQLLSRRDRHLPASASDVDLHSDLISSRFDCRGSNRVAVAGGEAVAGSWRRFLPRAR